MMRLFFILGYLIDTSGFRSALLAFLDTLLVRYFITMIVSETLVSLLDTSIFSSLYDFEQKLFDF